MKFDLMCGWLLTSGKLYRSECGVAQGSPLSMALAIGIATMIESAAEMSAIQNFWFWSRVCLRWVDDVAIFTWIWISLLPKEIDLVNVAQQKCAEVKRVYEDASLPMKDECSDTFVGLRVRLSQATGEVCFEPDYPELPDSRFQHFKGARATSASGRVVRSQLAAALDRTLATDPTKSLARLMRCLCYNGFPVCVLYSECKAFATNHPYLKPMLDKALTTLPQLKTIPVLDTTPVSYAARWNYGW